MILFTLVVPTGCLLGSVLSTIDVLREINFLAKARAGRQIAPPVAWRVVDHQGRRVGASFPCYAFANEREAARRPAAHKVLLVPPLMMVTIPGLRRLVAQNSGICHLLQAHAPQGWIGACGTGVWLLGRAGLLDNQPTPLPWLYQSGFMADFPKVPVTSENHLVVAHHLVMANAPSLVHELVLKLLDVVGLSDLASAARDKFLVNPERQHLVELIPEKVVGASRDAPLHRAIAWMEAHAGEPIAIGEVAKAVAVSERTLVRLFQRHMGRSPLRYLNELRVKRAQMWLEVTWRSIHEISLASGYSEPAAFRRMFRQITGITPAEHRARFTLRTPRAVWQVAAVEDVQGGLTKQRRNG